jgi:hypothetical protein
VGQKADYPKLQLNRVRPDNLADGEEKEADHPKLQLNRVGNGSTFGGKPLFAGLVGSLAFSLPVLLQRPLPVYFLQLLFKFLVRFYLLF